jgi:hypothetical protein
MPYERYVRSYAKSLGFEVTGHPSRGFTITDRSGHGIVRAFEDTLEETATKLDELVEFDRQRRAAKNAEIA